MIEAQRNASHLTRAGWRIEAMAWDAYNAWYRAKGLDRASDAGGELLQRLGPLTSTHRIARINMQRCFPEAAEPEIDRLLRGMWDNFGRLAGEMPHMHLFEDDAFFEERVEFIGREKLEAARDAKQPLVIVSTHSANWEISGTAISKTGLPCYITYRPANNPLIDQRILAARADYGIKLMTAKGGDGAKELLQTLKRGETVALMNDQKMNDGVEAPFFGHPSMTAPGPTKLAMRFNCPLVPLSVRRLEGARFRIEIHDPIEISTNPDKPAAIVETVTRINQWIEAEIRQAPEQWFWVHRRWAKDVYRQQA